MKPKEKNKDTDCLGEISMGAEDSETVKEKESEIDVRQKEKIGIQIVSVRYPWGLRILKHTI